MSPGDPTANIFPSSLNDTDLPNPSPAKSDKSYLPRSSPIWTQYFLLESYGVPSLIMICWDDVLVSVIFAKLNSFSVICLYSKTLTFPWLIMLGSEGEGHVDEFSCPIAIIFPSLLNAWDDPNIIESWLEISPVIVPPIWLRILFSPEVSISYIFTSPAKLCVFTVFQYEVTANRFPLGLIVTTSPNLSFASTP